MTTIQLVQCGVCCWIGRSTVKKILNKPGYDYPLLCRKCGAVSVGPDFHQHQQSICDSHFIESGGVIVRSTNQQTTLF